MSSLSKFIPPWVLAAQPYSDQHMELAWQNPSLLRMMSNENPLPPSASVLRAAAEMLDQANLYPDTGFALRQAIGVRNGLGADNVLLGNGSTEVIDMIVRTFVAPGDEVIIAVPTFSMYEARARVAGAVARLIPLLADFNFDLPSIHTAVGEQTHLLFLCSPNNPTSTFIAEPDLREVLARGIPTVVDEAYFEFEQDCESVVRLIHDFPNILVTRTFSKAYGIAGLRLGYVLAGEEIIGYLRRVRMPWNVGVVPLAAGLAAYEDRAGLAERVRLNSEGRDYLCRELALVRGFKVCRPAGNFVLVDAGGTGLTAAQLVERMLKEGIFIRPMAVHHLSAAFIRVTIGTPAQNERLVATFRRLLGEQP